MTWYQKIDMLQQPYDFGTDSSGRARVLFNVMALKRPSATFPGEIVGLLVAAGVGVYGTDIFLSTKALLPTTGGPFVLLVVQAGGPPDWTQDHVGPAYVKPGLQVFVHSPNFADAYAKALACYDALAACRNKEVTPSTL